MRFLHTADWHLGRLFHGIHLTADQEYALEQVLEIAAETKPDAVIIAGDLYDRAVPPPEAVALLDDVLSRLVLGMKIPVIAIAGNHDSPERLAFGSRLLRDAGLYLYGTPTAEPGHMALRDEHGPVHVYALPYMEPAKAREIYGDPDIRDHEAVLRAGADRVRTMHPGGERSILIGHAFVTGGRESESERPLAVGGATTVPADVFAGIDYTALGHLHGPQEPTRGRVVYAGSLLKYSFSEADHQKSVALVEMGAKGACTIERIAIKARHDVRVIEGEFHELLENAPDGPEREDYLLVRLTGKAVHHEPLARLRDVYPNVMQLDKLWLHEETTRSTTAQAARGLNETELFSFFFKNTTGEDPSPEQMEWYSTILEDLQAENREAEA